MEKKRNGEIDVLRFLFAALIVFYHTCQSVGVSYIRNGNIAVEFFFVVSGFLMAAHAANILERNGVPMNGKETIDETWRFIGEKVKSYYKYFLFALIFQVLLIDVILNDESFAAICKKMVTCIPSLTQTVMGFNCNNKGLYLAASWYLSAMLIAMFMLYPLVLMKRDFSLKFYFPLIAMFMVGYLYAKYNDCTVWKKWDVICYTGIIRSIGEIALGGFLFEASNFITERFAWLISSNNVLVKSLLSLFKISCYAFTLAYAIGGSWLERKYCIYALLFVSLGVLLSFSNVGYTIQENRVTKYLGKVSLPIYLFHSMFKNYLGQVFDPSAFSIPVFFAFSISFIIASIVLYYLTDIISDLVEKLFVSFKQRIIYDE